ncbi:MAG TPA: YggS family pyridoxal phosphate-dependent enzyme [Dehalococcoidales bacterium]|nr:YggS family pyridoxal phosphate-dependent enzyme [Dehalococcoidales bacterium]
MTIKQNVRKILSELPAGVRLVAAAKTREPREILEAIEGGAGIIGENYVQEAEKSREAVGGRAAWHFIGHLQRNKVKKAVEIFDMIETVDSAEIAREIDKRCATAGRTMPVLVEINSGREPQKSGVAPEDAEPLIREIAALPHIRVMGLMTMGPLTGHPEESRPCFAETKRVFDRIKGLKLPNVAMQYLSMGMTHSYRVALEEGANLIRIGTGIFGERPRK